MMSFRDAVDAGKVAECHALASEGMAPMILAFSQQKSVTVQI
jgi:hypothetical protein